MQKNNDLTENRITLNITFFYFKKDIYYKYILKQGVKRKINFHI